MKKKFQKNDYFISYSKWKDTVLSDDTSIQDVLKNLNKTGTRIALIVNNKKDFQGTISDGDIRRALIKKTKQYIELEDKSVKGFNIGMNSGEVAGQTIFHCHIHLIPRRVGDVRNPRGGVRHLIPGKGDY